jgi:FKBP-type peptidyl-prolyl cis-trans isomerase
MKYLINKMINKLTIFGFTLLSVILISACEEDKYADWKIMNDQWLEAFKEEHKNDSNFFVTESGLCYHVIYNDYKYTRPHPTSRIEVSYKGQLISGKVFDAEKGVAMYLPETIKGWQEGLRLMRDGWHFIFYVPSELAYGKDGFGLVPPYSVLKFDIELIKTDNY